MFNTPNQRRLCGLGYAASTVFFLAVVAIRGGEARLLPAAENPPSAELNASEKAAGIPSIRVIDDMGQWIEIRKGIKDRGVRD